MASGDFTQAVRRLAQYRPFEEEGRDIGFAVRDLALAASAVQGGGFDSLTAAQAAIKDLWNIEVELDELREVVNHLKERGVVTPLKGGFEPTPETLETLEQRAEASEKTEQEAFSTWCDTIRREHPQLTDGDVEQLSDDLRSWLANVIARHGVESALILYPENPRAQEFFDSIEKMGVSFLPTRTGRVARLRDWALQNFVREATAAQRTYLADLMNTSFYMTVLTLDSEASQLVQAQVAGHRVYLDTNFLYSLLGLGATAAETLSAARLIELTREVGYQLAVTQWTVDEFRTSIRAAEQRINHAPLPRQHLADLMVLRSGETDVTREYWKRYQATGVRPKDFFAVMNQVEQALREHGIEVLDEGCTNIDGEHNRENVDGQLVLLDRFLGGTNRDDRAKEHDVKHRLLIEKMRGKGTIGFSNAQFWFLTRDSRLPQYAMATLDGTNEGLPFCVSPSSWVQVMRAFTPRTDDFDKSLVELLSTPYLRRRGGPGISPEVVNAVVARVDMLKGATSELAAAVLTDTALVDSITQARDEAKRGEQIEHAIVMKAKELQEKVAASDQQLEAEAARRREAEARRESAEKEASGTRSRLAALEADAEQHAANRTAREKEEATRREEEAEQREQAERDLAAQQQQDAAERERLREEREGHKERADRLEHTLRVAVALVLALVGAGLVLLGVLVDLAWGWRIASLSGAGFAVCGAVSLALGEKRGNRVITFLFGFSGLIGIFIAVVPK